MQNCVVTLAAPGTGILEQAVSREDGRFVFTGFEIPEGTRFVVSAKTATGRENVYLVLDEVPSWFEGVPAPPLAASGKPHGGDHLESGQWQGYRNRTLEKLAREETMRDIFLEEVEVRAPPGKRTIPSTNNKPVRLLPRSVSSNRDYQTFKWC